LSELNLSILIPTYNRRETLLKTLAGYARQTAAARIREVLVVDDGSTDGTAAAVAGFAASATFPIRHLHKENGGLASARNFGIREAASELLLMGDDDIIPGPTLVEEHLAWHEKNPADNVAVLGYVTWSPELRPTPFMKWMGEDGVLFGFGRLVPGKDAPLEYCYFCNTSVKKRFLAENGTFDEDFQAYGFEDTELSYRLFKKGFCVLYNSRAVGYHYKHMSYSDVRRRAELVIRASALFESKEAGRYFKELSLREGALTGRRMKRALGRLAGPFVAPLACLLDTQVPLPRMIYQILYHGWIQPKVQRNLGRLPQGA